MLWKLQQQLAPWILNELHRRKEKKNTLLEDWIWIPFTNVSNSLQNINVKFLQKVELSTFFENCCKRLE